MEYGKIIVISGTMGAGKTTELIGIVKATLAMTKVAAFKPAIDNRYGKEDIVSHKGESIVANAVGTSLDLLKAARQLHEVGCFAIDEAQFFDDDLPFVVRSITALGKSVILAGLQLDSSQRPFGTMPTLMAYADQIIQVRGMCEDCFYHDDKEGPAYVSYFEGEGEAGVGGLDVYVPLCRKHAFERDMLKVIPEEFFEEPQHEGETPYDDMNWEIYEDEEEGEPDGL